MSSPEEKKIKILVIDDEFFFRTMLKDSLSEGGFEVITANDGEEGVELYKEELPDIVISDLIMPKKGGVSCCIGISSHAKTVGKDPLIILFSSMFNKEQIHAHDPPEMGAHVHMPKTIKPIDVLILVEELFGKWRRDREAQS